MAGDVTVPHDREWAPDLDELEQREDIAPTAVAVRLNDAVRTHELPARVGVMRSFKVSDTVPESVVGADLGRKKAHIRAIGQDVYLGTNAQRVKDGTGFYLPAGSTVDIGHCEQVWAMCATAGQSATLSLLTEEWAD